MRITKYILLFIGVTLLISGCSFDDLLSSDDAPPDIREPRDRREPTDPNDPGQAEPKEKPKNLAIYMPLRVGGKWFYDVEVTKISINREYQFTYTGQETWTCTQVNLNDSTITFDTTFNGSKTIRTSEGEQKFSESTAATVLTNIKKGALVLVEENGNSISPFLGDWLFLLKDRFKVCFDGDDIQLVEATTDDLIFDYEIDKTSGMLIGYLQAASEYERTEIIYSIFDYK